MKVRRVDFYPDDLIAGITGKLSGMELAVYWLIITLIYSKGGPIDDDHIWLSRILRDTHPRSVRAAIESLIAMGKVVRLAPEVGSKSPRSGPELFVNRCRSELERSVNRISSASENGAKGGRGNKKNNDLEKADGSGDQKPSLQANNQQTTTNKQQSSSLWFDDFWAVYPRKVGKGQATRAWKTAAKTTDLAVIIAAAFRFANECKAKQTEATYIPHPATWLNGRRWEDEPPSNTSQPPQPSPYGRALL